MTKVELTLAPTYLPNWTVADAIRELFQNALDQQTLNPCNTASWSYDEATETLTINNTESTLTMQSLLLGVTTKADDKTTIGQFGEGYKVATLVLLREGKEVTFYNYGAKEVWHPRFVKSKRFGTDILTFYIDKKAAWDKVPNNDLSVVITGITPEEYHTQIVPTNLHLQHEGADYACVYSHDSYGRVLATKTPQVFVNGLFVCDNDNYDFKYSYDFLPSVMQLDRDRHKVSHFVLQWETAHFWSTLACTSTPQCLNAIVDLICEDAPDVKYIHEVGGITSEAYSKLCNIALAKFYATYGQNTIPVLYENPSKAAPDGYHTQVIHSRYYKLVTQSEKYVPVQLKETKKVPLSDLLDWFTQNKHYLPEVARASFMNIYTGLESNQ